MRNKVKDIVIEAISSKFSKIKDLVEKRQK